jgi:predicted RecA/RadA family phage recombinase
MTIRYLKPGDALDYSNATNADIAVNDVVVCGSFVGVAAVNIPKGAVGTMLPHGVFAMPKKAGTAMPVGTSVTWSVADKAFVVGPGVSGDIAHAGVVVEQDAAAGDAAARIFIAPGMGAVVV